MDIVFWCEFPKECNWKRIIPLIDFSTEIYIASKTKSEYQTWKKLVQSKHIKTGVWPVLSKSRGYWFSGHTKKEDIDFLDQFKGLKIKLDLEPPFPNKSYNYLSVFLYLAKYLFKKGRNNQYLKDKIVWLQEHSDIIISTFPFPEFYIKRFGADIPSKNKNYIAYSTLFPLFLKPYLKNFIKNNPDARFAVGCIGPGIFGNEPIYKNIKEFKENLDQMKNLGVKKLSIFTIEAISKKSNPEKWIELIRSFS